VTRKLKSIICIVTVLVLVLTLFAGCGSESGKDVENVTTAESANTEGTQAPADSQNAVSGLPDMSKEKMVEYDAYFDIETVAKWFDNPKDVVSKWYEDTFKLKLTDIYWQSGQSTDQRIAAFIASNSFPDVMVANRASIFAALDQGMDLTELAPEHMPNYWNNIINDSLRSTLYHNGKVKFLYKYEAFGLDEQTGLNDPYFNQFNHTLMIREDILTKLGYKFTPISEIQKTCNDEQRAPTLADYNIDPVPYKTMGEFTEFLRKIKALELKDKSGNSVLPFSTMGATHVTTGFDFSTLWKWNDEKKVADGYLGSPKAKDALYAF
jgi:ABC-type glycerol-3-phosphate transport system substrate-binding protein